MSFLGNLLWFISAGFWQALSWFFIGLLWCITIVGIPVGMQCFKLARLACFPFGKRVENSGKFGSFLLNVLWLIFGGLPIAFVTFLNGILLCVTIIGIPFGIQCFKQARLALAPFGTKIVKY